MSLTVLLCTGLLLPQEPAPARPDQPAPAVTSLHEELARLVDAPTPASRRLAAEALAAQNLATVAQWTEACRTFGTFAAKEPGPTKQKVLLQVLDQVEPTEVHLFFPQGYDPQRPAPLLLWGHGAGGTGAREYLHWQEVADRSGLLVLAPTEFGKEPGYGHTPRERAAQLAALRWARRQANVDENAIFVGGWSRGGHLTWDLILRHPDLFAGALPCIGGPRMLIGPQNNLRYLENVVHLPIRDLQGSQDDPRLLLNLHLAFTRLQKFGAAEAVLKEFPDRGHDADLAAVDWVDFLQRRRDPRPARVVRLAADPAETRAGWASILTFEPAVAVDFQVPVNPVHYDKLDEAAQRAVVLDRLVERTARLVVKNLGQGRFAAEGKGTKSFALLLDASMLGKDGQVEVKWQGKTVRKLAQPSVAVLLREFAERFDRSFLPTAQVVVP